ncbi:MAG: hypothetical protein R3B70_21595 [Polyangiaceae bacterium]
MKIHLLGLSIVLVGALTAACSGADQNAANNTGGGTTSAGGNGGDGGSNTGGNNTGGNNTGGNNTGGKSTGGGGTGGSNTTGGAGGTTGTTTSDGPCGGIAGDECNPAQYCEFSENGCGVGEAHGTCVDKPDTCPDNVAPVCACDGRVYNNECEANAAGLDVSLLGSCPTPNGTIPCGYAYCDIGEEYCQITGSDVPGEPNGYACIPLPNSCKNDTATCACLADVSCGDMCKELDGGFIVTCPGG